MLGIYKHNEKIARDPYKDYNYNLQSAIKPVQADIMRLINNAVGYNIISIENKPLIDPAITKDQQLSAKMQLLKQQKGITYFADLDYGPIFGAKFIK